MVRHGPFSVPVLLLMLAALSGCIPQVTDRHRVRARAAPVPNSELMRQCTADLNKMGARYKALADYRGPGNCSAINSILLTGAGANITGLRATQCPLARNFAAWIRGPVQQAARDFYGQSIVRVETMGSYACRTVRGVASASLSEHAFANAIDVSGFVLASGRRITVLNGWTTGGDDAEFLRRIRKAACRQFQTVLSPDYNAAHRDHLHLDMGRGPYCR
ncbi:MAG: extensin family protein [Chakrabartia sp.]